PDALIALAQKHLQALPNSADAAHLEGLAAQAGRGRSHHAHRMGAVFSDAKGLKRSLEAFIKGDAEPFLESDRSADLSSGRVVFAFSGHGSQWIGMGRDLWTREPVFAQTLEACDAAIRAYDNWSLVDIIRNPEAHPWPFDVIQPALFGVSVA